MKYSLVLTGIPLALFAGIVGYQLFGPVPIGLANNNDFPRILGPLRLWPASPYRDNPNVLFRYFVNDYVIADPRYNTGIPSSERLVAVIAKRIARAILPVGRFQLSLMGLVHGAILFAALAVFLNALRTRSWWLRLAGGFLLLFVWTDLEYVQQLSTAYPDAGAVVSLALLFSIAVHSLVAPEGGRWPLALTFGAFGCFLLATKLQHETALPFLIAFCAWLGWRGRPFRDRVAWLTAAFLFLATAAYMIETTPRSYRVDPAFTLVFYKLAVLSPDPQGVLADFGMSGLRNYVGHYAYESGTPVSDPEFRQRLLNRVTPASLASFYWRHPGLLTKVLRLDLQRWAPDLDLASDYGHLREEEVLRGKHPFELVAWSRFRAKLFTVAPLHLVYLFGLVVLSSTVCIRRPKIRAWLPLWPAALLSALLALSSFLFASLLDGVETPRHLVFFQASTDLVFVSIGLTLLLLIDDRARRTLH